MRVESAVISLSNGVAITSVAPWSMAAKWPSDRRAISFHSDSTFSFRRQ